MYESFYKLAARPFQLSPDPRFFFGSSGHKRALAYLQYGVAQGEGFIVITGGVGTGKTTLVRTLVDSLENEDITVAKLTTTQLEADDLLRIVAASFGLEYEGLSKAALLRDIEKFLTQQAWEDKRVLLIVDEAQNLSGKALEELRMLSNFQVADVALLQTFLLGQDELRKLLQSGTMEQMTQRVIASCHLKPLNREETKEYIEHRLKRAEWAGVPSFSEAAFDDVFSFTGGIPRRINTLCDRVLLYGCLEGLERLDSDAVRTVIEELQEEVTITAGNPVTGKTDSQSDSKSRLDERLERLEEKVAELEEAMQLERARLNAIKLKGIT